MGPRGRPGTKISIMLCVSCGQSAAHGITPWQKEEAKAQGSAHRQPGCYKDEEVPSLSPSPPPEQGGSITSCHGCRPRVRRALSLAWLGQHRPSHDPLVPLTSSLCGVPVAHPHPRLAGSGLSDAALFLPGLSPNAQPAPRQY